MEYKDFSFSGLKAIDDSGTFEGSLAVYHSVDAQGDSIQPGAFTKTLQESGGIVPLLWQHQTDQVIGSLHLHDSSTALRAKGRLLLRIPKAAEAYELLKEGVLRGLSIGYKTIVEAPMDNVRKLREIRLFEGSLVTFQAHPLALVHSVKATDEDLEALEMFRSASRDMKEFYSKLL